MLNLALGIIPPVSVVYNKYLGSTISEVGTEVPNYDTQGVEFAGSVQRVRTEIYEAMGLNFQKKYKVVFVPEDALSIADQKAPDKFTFYGKSWVIVGDVGNWYDYDGWNAILVVAEKDYQWK